MPLLGYVQFPWRMLALLSMADAVLLAALSERASRTALKAIVSLAGLTLIVALLAFPRHWTGSAEIDRVETNIKSGSGYLSSPEYWPAGIDMKTINPPAPVTVADGSAKVDVEQWTAEERLVKVDAASPARLSFRLMYYPAWHAEVNGQPAAPSRAGNGLLELMVPAGQSEVRLHFVYTADRTFGAILSLLSWTVLLTFAIRRRRVGLGFQVL
jgi:hypothetical protein